MAGRSLQSEQHVNQLLQPACLSQSPKPPPSRPKIPPPAVSAMQVKSSLLQSQKERGGSKATRAIQLFNPLDPSPANKFHLLAAARLLSTMLLSLPLAHCPSLFLQHIGIKQHSFYLGPSWLTETHTIPGPFLGIILTMASFACLVK